MGHQLKTPVPVNLQIPVQLQSVLQNNVWISFPSRLVTAVQSSEHSDLFRVKAVFFWGAAEAGHKSRVGSNHRP